jgi:116 kDa U5 small nuclear ribonucleoprotein component
MSLTVFSGSLDVNGFADRLWGDIYFENRRFTRKQSDPEALRTFVQFILEPLYKLYTQVLSEETDDLRETLFSLGITLKPVMYKMDVRPLLKVVLDQFFGPSTGLVDMIVENIPSPVEAAASRVRTYPSYICPFLQLSYSCSLPGGADLHRPTDLRTCYIDAGLRS